MIRQQKSVFTSLLCALCLVCNATIVAVAQTSSDHGGPARTYSNPILEDISLADPDVILVDGTYFMYPTSHGAGYDVWMSTNLVNWTARGSVFKSAHGGAWAPDVFHNKRGDGKYYLYYTDSAPTGPQHGPFNKQIGVAVSDSPTGPFEDKKVLASGSIDAHLFQDDDGQMVLYYVEISDGFKILEQRMSDPLTKEGEPVELIHPTEAWEMISGRVTEGPFMLKHGDTYYLMYSGTGADSPNYGIGYATAKSPLGPFKKSAENPIAHRSQPGASPATYGPGHHCVVTGPDGKLWMIYHQKYDDGTNYRRFLALDPIWFDDDGRLQTRVTRDTPEPVPSK